jgi:hypothetical protein
MIVFVGILFFTADANVFPLSVQECDVSEGLLQRAFLQCLEGRNDLDWILIKPVTIGFYRDLHCYLRHWPVARSATKTMVGRFYVLVDVNFKSGISARPDNVYMFVHKLAISNRSSLEPMYYGMDKAINRTARECCVWLSRRSQGDVKQSVQTARSLRRNEEAAGNCKH